MMMGRYSNSDTGIGSNPEIYLEVEVQYDDHLPVTRLEDGVLDVVVENVHFVAADRREAETWRREV